MKEFLIKIIYFIIEFIEKVEYINLDLDENDVNKKIIDTIELPDNLMVESDSGLVRASHIHLTQPYKHYEIELSSGKTISCADNHIVFKSNLEEVLVKDLKIGDLLFTNMGEDMVISIKKTKKKTSMGDLTIDHPNHRYYTNGILSHNTITSAIFMIHTILFSNDKNIMIVANKGDTTIEIVDKIKSIYSLLPFFLKPGVKIWNQKSLTFDSGCRVKTSARTKTPAIGFTIDVLYLDEFAHIPSNIIGPYYTAAFPTVSAIKNSKIIITSTPNGMNLFHDILENAERPPGDPKKNNYKATRVYWYQVPGRFVTYIRLNDHKLYDNKMTKEEVFEIAKDKWGEDTKVEMRWDVDIQKDVIDIHNNDKCKDKDIKDFIFENGDGLEIKFQNIAEVTTWKDEAIKDIGGEDAFNQEYGLRFVNASKSLLNESIIENLIKNKKEYEFRTLDPFSKLRFSYENLTWLTDENIFDPNLVKDYKVVLSVDLSEGLGQDYSVINIFKISCKSKELIEEQKDEYESIVDFFKLDQIGIYRSNTTSIRQLAELLYILAFEYLNPDNVKIVLELNNYGNTLLAEMPHVFDGNNQYGSFIFTRFKHKADSLEEKIGLKLGNNKNLLVKDYQDLMLGGSFNITNTENIHEITTFVKHVTPSGNVRYAADVGNDDTVMTIVNSTAIFKKNEFKEWVEDYIEEYLDDDMRNYIEDCLENSEYFESVDYTQLLDIRRKHLNKNKGGVNDYNRYGGSAYSKNTYGKGSYGSSIKDRFNN